MKSLTLPFYRGWIVVATAFLVLVVIAGVQSASPVLVRPLEKDLHLDRSSVSLILSGALVFYGVACPLAGTLTNRLGARRLALLGLALTGLCTSTVVVVEAPWLFAALWAGSGLGSGLATAVLGMTIANQWFPARRGLILGILGSAGSIGHLVFVTTLMRLVLSFGWRPGIAILGGAVFLAIALAGILLDDGPSNVVESAGTESPTSPSLTDRSKLVTSGTSSIVRSQAFWLLAGSFSICGATASGLVGTHLIAHAVDQGLPDLAAANLVAILAATSAVGAAASGWLSDRYDPRKVLASYFVVRAVLLIFLPFIDGMPGLVIFSAVFGLDSIATTPPTAVLVSDTFGHARAGINFGWLLGIHHVSAAAGAYFGGEVHAIFGDYRIGFFIGGIFTFAAAAMALRIASPSNSSPAISSDLLSTPPRLRRLNTLSRGS